MLTTADGTVTGSASPATGYADDTLNAAVTVTGAADSSITAAGGVNLGGPIPGAVGTDGGRLLVPAVMANEPGKNEYVYEPNPHVSPGDRWVTFTATRFGTPRADAVEVPPGRVAAGR